VKKIAPTMRQVTFNNHHDLDNYCANKILDQINESQNRTYRKTLIGISGGFSFTPIYRIVHDQVRKKQLSMENVVFFLIDDRFVNSNSKDANPHKYLLQDLNNVTFLYPRVDTLELEPCIQQYNELIENMLKENGNYVDLVTIKFGEDGHVAGLFPPLTQQATDESRSVIHMKQSKFPVPDRISVTLPFFDKVENTLMVVKGDSKLESFKLMKKELNNVDKWPAASLLNKSSVEVVFCDPHNKLSEA
jgi:6-phosphogluconolactonase/glucosamine-6-phosphate isomerase/deaminase